ncbi:MAG: hypothetical protein PHN56_00860 [Candidatus Nanoarchaeia archaeon]|nr:hypothetical protein [Candidatus Nanoarchaeia archaeon]
MSDFSDVYGLFFVGLVVVLLFITCYKIVFSNHAFIDEQLNSDYLASKFKTNLGQYNASIIYNKTFTLPKFDVFKNKIVTVISSE